MRRLPALLAVSAALALVLVSPAVGDRNAYRAAVSFWAMQHVFLDHASGLYREREGQGAIARAWPYSQALSATMAMSRVPKRGRLYTGEAKRQIAELARY